MKYNLITLDLFLCASKHQSLAKAAEEKNLVVSAVSKRILDLEKSVGVNLFYRKNSGVELTPAGHEMQKHCMEVFISIKNDDKKKIIAAIHAGWKGAYKNIINKVIKFMIKKGCELNNMTAAIGPSISLKNYEVKEDFKKKFVKKDKKNLIFFKINKKKLYFDLTNHIYTSLKKNGIKYIDVLKVDTFDIKHKFFSARRALKLKHNDYGRNISIIMLN